MVISIDIIRSLLRVIFNNKLCYIPKELWTAPKLKGLNKSFDLLTDLPNYKTSQPMSSFDGASSGDLSSSPTISDQSSVSYSDDDINNYIYSTRSREPVDLHGRH